MLKDLVEAVRRYTDARGEESPFVTAIEGVTILRSDHEGRRMIGEGLWNFLSLG
jgi:hypothetical protein